MITVQFNEFLGHGDPLLCSTDGSCSQLTEASRFYLGGWEDVGGREAVWIASLVK